MFDRLPAGRARRRWVIVGGRVAGEWGSVSHRGEVGVVRVGGGFRGTGRGSAETCMRSAVGNPRDRQRDHWGTRRLGSCCLIGPHGSFGRTED